MTIIWLSRHDLSPAQQQAIRSLHGENVEIVKDPVVFQDSDHLSRYIEEHSNAFIYAVAGAPHYVAAALSGKRFGIFENHPGKRNDGSFGLATVYHVGDQKMEKVWVNSDPNSDEGEALMPVTGTIQLQ